MGPDNSSWFLDKAKHLPSAPPEELSNFMKWLLQSGVPTYARTTRVPFPTTVVLLSIARRTVVLLSIARELVFFTGDYKPSSVSPMELNSPPCQCVHLRSQQ